MRAIAVRAARAGGQAGLAALLVLGSAVGALAQPLEGQDAWAGRPAIRGATVGPIESSLYPGRGYGSPSSDALNAFLVREGATWISITPFARIYDLDSTALQMDFEAPYETNREAVRTMIAQAHRRGLKVLLIPHLWVDHGDGWRGEIDPGSPEGWEAYQASYRAMILAWARDAADAGADAFSIGVECKSWSYRFGGFWDGLIAEIRSFYPGYLTYSANWDEAEDVVFWEGLDFIGVNAFYPLSDHPRATYAEYVASAERVRDGLADLSAVVERPVLFVEVGYTNRVDAAFEPWLWPEWVDEVVLDEVEQARALEAVLTTFGREEWFAGWFVWRYYADLDDASQEAWWGFSPHAKRSERTLRWLYGSRFAVAGSPYALGPIVDRPEVRWLDLVREADAWTDSSVPPRVP
jgi:hypothetical protein